MPGELHGDASWPGIIAVMSCQYTISHGTQPGVAILTTQPQDDPPDLFGDLVISDGNAFINLPNCKVQSLKAFRDSSGLRWTLEIVDRRFRWRDTGYVSGAYNVRDEHHFIWPYTVRTPTDLAILCLEAMGEVGYTIELPDDFLPEVTWDWNNPAQTLEQLAREKGCVVIYRLDTDTVWVTQKGIGDDLPDGSISRAGPTLQSKPRPDRIIAVGAPTRHQTRMKLEAVGKEWDGYYLPIQYLSYAPILPQQAQIVRVVPSAVIATNIFRITIDGKDYTFTSVLGTGVEVSTALAAAIDGDPFNTIDTAAFDGTGVLITGYPNRPFTVEIGTTRVGATASRMTETIVQEANDPRYPWDFCAPPTYSSIPGSFIGANGAGGAAATDRLTHIQAIERAQDSVFRCYRITGLDEAGIGPLPIPGYGLLSRIQQIVLTNDRVEQTTPNVPIQTLTPAERLRLDRLYYDGWSRNQPAVAYGSVYRGCFGYLNVMPPPGSNTLPSEQILVSFEVDPIRWLITFSRPVFFLTASNRCRPAEVFLDCAIQIRDPNTQALNRYTTFYDFPGDTYGTGAKIIRRPDLFQNYIGRYDQLLHSLRSTDIDLPDMDARAAYYLLGEAQQWFDTDSGEAEYNGILPVVLDGAIAQVTWSVGEGGAKTHVSRNTEHSIFVPTLPERLRQNHLAPAMIEQRREAEVVQRRQQQFVPSHVPHPELAGR